MPKVNVSQSILVDAPVEKVFPLLNDFHHWISWSPWLIMEPDVKVNVREDGKFYSWEGKVTGSGNMTLVSEENLKRIDYDLTFLTPFKSKAKVAFTTEKKESKTLITWFMDTSLPFFMFWMKKNMEVFIGMDYKRGLELLKDLAETGEVKSKLSFIKNGQFNGGNCISTVRECAIKNIDTHMERDFTMLLQYASTEHADKINGHSFSIYDKYDPVKNIVKYRACVPLNEIPSNLPNGMESYEVKSFGSHIVHHKGSYRHIANAWTAQQMYARSKQFKMDKKISPIEVYLNSPMNTEPDELETEIHFGIKR